MTAKPYRSHEDATVESFAKDPVYAAEYLNAVLDDGDEAELLVALNRLTKAFGGVTSVAEQVDLNGTSLYRTLSKNGNPELKTLVKVLRVMHLRLAVRPATTPVGAAPSGTSSVSPSGLTRQQATGQFFVKKLEPKRRYKANVQIRQFAETAGAGGGRGRQRVVLRMN
jgi:probable addiction module antidote protein